MGLDTRPSTVDTEIPFIFPLSPSQLTTPMNSSEFRQSFLDFFKSKAHEIVPSAPLLPTAPNLLFTNAGMNQFIPYFLGERTPTATRVADTQKCIRAGGKHNDLEDVGFDTYHHTFFEMLGNWSFGDYFKQEALTWSWELLTQVWKIPPERLYATVYKPDPGDPAEADLEALEIWKSIFHEAGLDPAVHVIQCGKKDNFWMMGDTGPCGPCSEIHIDCTEKGDTKGSLVNQDSAWCMEIWNNVFIQFNATPEGSYEPLPAKHVDTGMGFERVAGVAATTDQFTRFGELPSNYNSDLFTDIFKVLTQMSGHPYGATLPESGQGLSETELKDCAFRVVADHLRCLSTAIADGILPGNEGRNYVIRRILRRAVLWAERAGLEKGSLASIVPSVIEKLGPVFPELQQQQEIIEKVIASEESAFNRTLDRGIQLLERAFEDHPGEIPGEKAFELYDTYGFPLDLTQLMAREKGHTVDEAGFAAEMEKQRQRARAAQKKEDILVQKDAEAGTIQTQFVGFEPANLTDFSTTITKSLSLEEKHYLVLAETPFYAEMGGQLGDTGTISTDDTSYTVIDTVKDSSGQILHQVKESLDAASLDGTAVTVSVDVVRRQAIQRNHTATHILNWALREVLGNHIRQAGSLVAPEYLRFDFSHFEAVTSEQLATIEAMVNERIIRNDAVAWYEIPYDQKPDDVVAVFGEKYGDEVRVVDIGAEADVSTNYRLMHRASPGYSAELCGGTHVLATGEIGSLKIVSESSISAGTRRIEAVVGAPAFNLFQRDHNQIVRLGQLLSCPPDEVETRLQSTLKDKADLEKRLKASEQKGVAALAGDLKNNAISGGDLSWVVEVVKVSSPNDLRGLGAQVQKSVGPGVVILGATFGDKVTLVALCTSEANAAGIQAGQLIRDLTSKLDGKGGGKPDFAMGGGKAVDKLPEVLRQYKKSISSS